MTGSSIAADHLAEFATAVYASLGVPEPDARLAADTLVQADLWAPGSSCQWRSTRATRLR